MARTKEEVVIALKRIANSTDTQYWIGETNNIISFEGLQELASESLKLIESQPNIVRCEGCKHWQESFSNGKHRFGMCGKTFGMIYTPEIHFCYDGERKEQTDG